MREQWDQIKEILGSALERSPEDRLDFVRQACGDDEGLLAEIESLLESHDAADTLLEDSPAASLFSGHASTMIGRQVGMYRILGEIGQGGMAAVYLAERADREYRKRVAIKMVKPGANYQEIVRRFRNERQTLASLDHPHIVKLLDGGTTDEGWPYLVMDLVDGIPIDQYCDNHRVSIRGRLSLFCTVCAAVQHAHRHMVIHRDLKPANILITHDGVPQLLDFGIAKLLDPEYFQTSVVTTMDRRPMTPEYASPEQVRGEPVSNTTDIYSLGVLLYELLTGHRPYRATLSCWQEIERLVCQEEPPRPSTTVNRGGEEVSSGTTSAAVTPELVSLARHTTPEELRRCLQGDLDRIVMMALRKEPQRRYASADELSDDIQRHLAALPVKARRPTMFYRGEKFLRRHRESVAAVLLAAALMAGFSFWQARRTPKERAAEPSTSVAHIAPRPSVAILGFKNLSSRRETAWLSTALSEMLTTELASGGALRLIPGETIARAKIELSLPDADSFAPDTLRRVRQDLSDDFVVSGSYLYLGQGTGSEIRLDLRLQDTAKGETVAAVSETGREDGLLELVSRSGAYLRQQLGVVEVSRTETAGIRASSPSNPEALRLYAQGLAKLRTFDALAARDLLTSAVAADPSFPLAHSALAQAWRTLGYDANASRESKTALELAGKLPREDHLVVEARYDEAATNWEKAIENYKALFSFFPDTLDYGLFLAGAQARGGRGKDALQTLAAMVEASPQATDDPRVDLATSEAASSLGDNRLRRDAAESAAAKAAKQGARLLVARARALECRALANLGENDRAQTVCEEGRQIYAEAGDHGGMARILHSMAEVPLNRDDLATAEKLYRQALSLTREIGDKQGTARELVNLALVYKKRGDLVTAQSLNEQSLQNYTESGDKASAAMVTNNLGNLLLMQGRMPEARNYYEESLAPSREVGNKGNAALAMDNIGETLAGQGDLPGASAVLRQALAARRELGEKSYAASTLVTWGQVIEQQGDLDQARKNYIEALSMQEQLGEKGSTAETRTALAGLDCNSGKTAEAEPLARAALEESRRLSLADGQLRAEVVLSRSLLGQGKIDEARQVMTAALKRSENNRNVRLRLSCSLAYADVVAATRNLAEAESLAQQVLGQARQLGLLRLDLEASLLLGGIEMRGKDPAAGRARLEEVEKLARKTGFALIVRQAAALQH